MDLHAVVSKLGVADSADALSVNWSRSQSAMPKGDIEFLTPGYVRWECGAVFLPDDMTEALARTAGRIAKDEAISAFAWYCHYCLFRCENPSVSPRGWPLLTSALGRDAGLFNVLVLLSGTRRMQEFHNSRGISAEIVHDTVLNLKWHLEEGDYREDYGQWGITPRILGWLLRHWRGNLYRLGRFHLAFGDCQARLRAFRHRTKGTVIALSEEGVRYRSDGQIDGAGGIKDSTGAWTSTLTITDKAVAGYPIDPRSFAIRQETELPTAEWRQELAPGDPIIEIHIPAGSPMAFGECAKSLRMGLEFFPKHFPEKPFVAFTCHSWILDAQFEQILPPSSNLVRFQKEVYLFPIHSGTEGTLKTVFGRKMKDLATAPRDTTMQRAFAEHVERGGHFRGGGCFILPRDSDWGSQFYRSQIPCWNSLLSVPKGNVRDG